MLSMKLLLVFSLLTGIVAEECSVDFALEDFSDKITVTNTSASDAFVAVKTNHGQATMYVEGGKSRTATVLLATKYTAKVGQPFTNREYGTYRDKLLFMRDQLLSLTQKPQSATPEAVMDAWTELSLVQAALDQMQSDSVQSCSGTITAGKASQITLSLAKASVGESLWVLDCS